MTGLAYLNALRALEATVRHGSFTEAAEELGVTPAAVGQQVRKLEQALGRVLLVRRANGFEVSLTAQQAAAKLAAGFSELREAVAMLENNDAPLKIAVTVVPTIAEHWLAPRLVKFRNAHREIDLRIDSTHHVHYRSGVGYDFALRYDPPQASAWRGIDLFREWLVPICTPDVAARVRLGAGKRALDDVPLIDVDRSTVDPDWIEWTEWGERFGYRIKRPTLHFTFTTLALRAAYEGHGIFLAQLSITLPDILAGRMVAPFGPARLAQTGFPYRLIALNPHWRRRHHQSFMDWIEAEAGKTRTAMEAYMTLHEPEPRRSSKSPRPIRTSRRRVAHRRRLSQD